MPQTDAPPSSSVSFPTQDTPPPRSPAKDAAYRAPSTGIPKLGSRSTSFAIVQDSSPHRSSVPSPLGPGGGSRRRVVTQTPTSSTRKGKERENNYAGEIFGGFGLGGVGEDLYLGPDDSEVAEDVQRLLTRRENRQRTKDSLTSSTTTSSTSTVRSPATPPPPTLPPGRPTPTKAQTSPATVPRSAPTTPSKPPRVPATSLPSLRPTTSTEALVIYDNPTASSSKTTLDWSGYLPQEQSPKKHKRTFSLTRKRKVSKTELQTSDTGGEDADTFEASLKAIRDRTSENTWHKVAAAKQELSARYGTFFRFLNEFNRAFNPAEVVRWRARHSIVASSTSAPGGLISTASLPSFAVAASDPAILLYLDNGPKTRFRITSPVINEWFEAEVRPPAASEVLNTAPSSPNKTLRALPKNRPRGASLSTQQTTVDGHGSGSPADSGRRIARHSQPGTSLDSLKGPLNAMLAAARKHDKDRDKDGADHSGASLAKLSAKAKRAFRRDHSPVRSHPTSAANSDDESGASQHRKVSVSVSRPPTPDARSGMGGVDSATDDDARSGRSFGHIAKKSWHNLLGMTANKSDHKSDRDRMSEMSPMQLSPFMSPVGSTDAVGKTLDEARSPKIPYLHAPNWDPKRRTAVTTKSSEEYMDDPHIRKMYQQRARDVEHLRRERETTRQFLHSVADTLREYARLQRDFGDLLGAGGRAIDDQVLASIDLDPFNLPRSSRRLASWRGAEEVAARIQAQSRAMDTCLSQCDRNLMRPPGPELGEGLNELLTALHALEAEREELTRTADELAALEPQIDRLNDELEWEVADVGRVVAQSYGIKTSTTVFTSQWESTLARFIEFILTRGAEAYRYIITHKRVWVPIVSISLVYGFSDTGWGRWVVWYFYTALITMGLGMVFAFVVVVAITFIAKGGYSNAPTFAN